MKEGNSMKLTSQDALKMIENAIGKTTYDDWIYHSICVRKCCSEKLPRL